MHHRKVSGIIACDPQGVIAYKHKLPWYYPEDLAFYRKTTEHQINIMGYTTFLELSPAFIEKRCCVVFTQKKQRPRLAKNVIFVHSLAEFNELSCLPPHQSCYLIGGAQITRLFIENNRLDDLFLTEINKCYPGDTFFPLELIANWPKSCIKKTSDFTINHYINPNCPQREE